jgi:hypothetical protein
LGARENPFPEEAARENPLCPRGSDEAEVRPQTGETRRNTARNAAGDRRPAFGRALGISFSFDFPLRIDKI